jgi:hypothetical protein
VDGVRHRRDGSSGVATSTPPVNYSAPCTPHTPEQDARARPAIGRHGVTAADDLAGGTNNVKKGSSVKHGDLH